jgi:hypothetical protein
MASRSFGGAFGIQAVAVAHDVFDVRTISHPIACRRSRSTMIDPKSEPFRRLDSSMPIMRVGPLSAFHHAARRKLVSMTSRLIGTPSRRASHSAGLPPRA